MKLLEPQTAEIVEPNELARRAQLGSSDAIEALVDYFRPRLVYLLQRRLNGTLVDAEDVVQDSLLKACQQIHTFDPKYQFSTWVFTIAIRTATDALRKQGRGPKRAAVEWEQMESRSNPLPVAEESTDRIWSIAEKVLRKSQHEVLWLKYGEELSIAEVARVLGRTQVGVRVLLHRARAKLQSALAAQNSSPQNLVRKSTGSVDSNRMDDTNDDIQEKD